MTPLPRVLGCLLLASLAGGCALWRGGQSAVEADDEVARIPYRPDRRDYLAFRQAYSELLEPNYMPFMVHRVAIRLLCARHNPPSKLFYLCCQQ